MKKDIPPKDWRIEVVRRGGLLPLSKKILTLSRNKCSTKFFCRQPQMLTNRFEDMTSFKKMSFPALN